MKRFFIALIGFQRSFPVNSNLGSAMNVFGSRAGINVANQIFNLELSYFGQKDNESQGYDDVLVDIEGMLLKISQELEIHLPDSSNEERTTLFGIMRNAFMNHLIYLLNDKFSFIELAIRLSTPFQVN